jgi:uroporphyrinogen decarboxylase
MTPRERWNRVLHFRSVDRLPDEEFGYWDDTLRRWHGEGLPPQVDSNEKADRYFAFDTRAMAPVNIGLIPPFEARVIEETEDRRVIIDSAGVTSVQPKDGHSTIPKYLDHSLKAREDWNRFKERLDPSTPGRVPTNLDKLAARFAGLDCPVGVSSGSLFGWLRDWMGFEGISVACADDPLWVQEMMEQLTVLFVSVIEPVARQVKLDFAAGWEDMCYRSGPIISPRMFREFMVPRYKRITDALRRNGCDVVIVDCDGSIGQLVGLWLEGGVNAMFPLEVGGGTDPEALRRRFGKDILLLGGVDKRALIASKAAIDAEVVRVARLAEQGGYIPHVDHRVPADVSYENYLYYLRRKRDALGIPQKEPVEFWRS